MVSTRAATMAHRTIPPTTTPATWPATSAAEKYQPHKNVHTVGGRAIQYSYNW